MSLTSVTNDQNLWFSVSMCLLGIIVGFGAATVLNTRAGSDALAAIPSVPGAPTVAQAPPQPAPPATPPSVDDDAVLGKADAPVTLIEFTDYQCPFCGRHFEQTHPKIQKEYIETGKVKFVVRDFPLSFHQNAQKASEATECAGDGGKFWEMHDLLFTKQKDWANATGASDLFKQYAADLGIPKSFSSCLDTGTYAAEVQKDLTDGSTSGIDGTPGFWVLGSNGQSRKISGAVPFESFQKEIDAMLAIK